MFMSTMTKEARVPEADLKPGDPGYVPPRPRATATMELITPDLAEDYLERMHANRTVSKIEKGVMSQLLRDGEFYGEISPIYFDDNGDWMQAPGDQDPWDGQHRLESIIETGIPAWMWVIRGVSADAAEFIDTGRRRQYSDNLKIGGIADYQRQAVLARQMALYSNYGIEAIRNPNTFPVTRPQMDRWVDSPGMLEAIHFGVKLYKYSGVSESAGAYAVMRTARVDERDADGNALKVTIDPTGFWAAVRDGTNLERGDPAKALRDWMLRKRLGQAPADKRLITHYALATAWNKHAEGKPYVKVQPTYERRRVSGSLYFPAKSVPDYKVPGEAARLLEEAREAYAVIRGNGSDARD